MQSVSQTVQGGAGFACHRGCMDPLANTPEPPYYAVIFTSTASTDSLGYGSAAARMLDLAAQQPGYLGVESASERGDGGQPDGCSITVSYWESEGAIAAWKAETEHSEARDEGRARWYDGYELRVAKVERAYNWRR